MTNLALSWIIIFSELSKSTSILQGSLTTLNPFLQNSESVEFLKNEMDDPLSTRA